MYNKRGIGYLLLWSFFFSFIIPGEAIPKRDTVVIITESNTTFDDWCMNISELTAEFDTINSCGDPQFGTLLFNGYDHCVDYAPNEDFVGVDEMCIWYCGTDNVCDTTVVLITVTAVQCIDFLPNEIHYIPTKFCLDEQVYCIPLEYGHLPNYDITYNGVEIFPTDFGPCNTIPVHIYDYKPLPNMGMIGPITLNNWVVNGTVYSGTFDNLKSLVYQMKIWDIGGEWQMMEASFYIKGGEDGSIYGALELTIEGESYVIGLQDITVSLGSSIDLALGEHTFIFTDKTTGCSDSIKVNLECQLSETNINTTLFFENSNTYCPSDFGVLGTLDSAWNVCPEFSGNSSIITQNDSCFTIYGQNLGQENGCFVFCTQENGCQQINIINQVLDPSQLPDCNNISEEFIAGIGSGNCEEDIEICFQIPYPNIDDFQIYVDGQMRLEGINDCGNMTGISFSQGVHDLVFYDITNNCIDSVEVLAACVDTEIIIDTLQKGTNEMYCLSDDQLMGAVVTTINECPEQSGDIMSVVINEEDQCVLIVPKQGGDESVCMVMCDEYGVCDTTFILIHVIDDPIVLQANDDTLLLKVNLTKEINLYENDIINGGKPTLKFINHPNFGELIEMVEDDNWVYSPDLDFCNSSIYDPIVYELCIGEVCSQATIYVKVICDDFLVNDAFSPDGNGQNETFTINGLDEYEHMLTIYNRYGMEVYKSDNYKNDWGGTWSGGNLPDGTYFYLIRYGDNKRKSGYIVLMRN